jgi:outer membrane protein assembly factor BamB
MAGLNRDFVYVGIGGHVVALDVATGTERWRTKLRGRDIVYVVSDGGRLYAVARGELYCLDGTLGTILWQNRLEGMGLGLATVVPGVPVGQVPGAAIVQAHRRRSAH